MTVRAAMEPLKEMRREVFMASKPAAEDAYGRVKTTRLWLWLASLAVDLTHVMPVKPRTRDEEGLVANLRHEDEGEGLQEAAGRQLGHDAVVGRGGARRDVGQRARGRVGHHGQARHQDDAAQDHRQPHGAHLLHLRGPDQKGFETWILDTDTVSNDKAAASAPFLPPLTHPLEHGPAHAAAALRGRRRGERLGHGRRRDQRRHVGVAAHGAEAPQRPLRLLLLLIIDLWAVGLFLLVVLLSMDK